jgi:acetyl esterase/lipase
MILKSITIYILIIAGAAFAQHNINYSYPRDTTYTLKIAYGKYKKDYPFIKDVQYDTRKGHLVKSICYDSSSGRPLMLDIFSNADDTNPAKTTVILIHGGGWSSGDRSMMHPLADYLASKGYIGITIEFRLSPEAQYPAAVNDIKKAIGWILKSSTEYHIDTKHIAILGCSAGAQLAGLVGLTYRKQYENPVQKFIHAIINVDGLMDFTSADARAHEDNNSGELRPAARWLGGRYSDIADIWKEASPVYYVNENSPPVLFINSSQPRFHVGRDETIRILDKYSIYSEIHTFDDAPHSFWLFDPWFERTAQFIDNFLQYVFNNKSNK